MPTRRFHLGFGDRAASDVETNIRIGRGFDFDISGIQQTMRRHGLLPSEIGLDLLSIGIAVYFADVSANRAELGDDGWTRHLDLVVEVSQPELWEALTERIVRALNFVSSDRWRLRFNQRLDDIETAGFVESRNGLFQTARISLLSGGLDSATAAIDMLCDGEPLMGASISSSDTRTVGGPQNAIRTVLSEEFQNAFAGAKLTVQVPSSIRGANPESSQRARSFLFLTFSSFLASCYPHRITLVVPENGLIALNVPLDVTRMGSNSTKTAHPFFLYHFQLLLDGLGLNARLDDPYRFVTKGEMLHNCTDKDLLARILPLSVSCAKPPNREGTADNHCGCCPACIIRRAAILAGFPEPDPTSYHTVPDLGERTLNARTKEGKDIRAFKIAAQRLADHPEYAEVDVYRAGPLVQVVPSVADYVEVYRRGMMEVHALLADVRTEG